MLKIDIEFDKERSGSMCHFEATGQGELLDIEMTIATTVLIKRMAQINHCSFETAALMLIQQSSMLYKQNTKEFDK